MIGALKIIYIFQFVVRDEIGGESAARISLETGTRPIWRLDLNLKLHA